jgi:hypothetical protein
MTTMVELPANAFQTVVNLRAKTADYIFGHLDELGATGLPFLAVDDAEATQQCWDVLKY